MRSGKLFLGKSVDLIVSLAPQISLLSRISTRNPTVQAVFASNTLPAFEMSTKRGCGELPLTVADYCSIVSTLAQAVVSPLNCKLEYRCPKFGPPTSGQKTTCLLAQQWSNAGGVSEVWYHMCLNDSIRFILRHNHVHNITSLP